MPTLIKELAERKQAKAREALAEIGRIEALGRLPTDDEREGVKRLVQESQDYAEQMTKAAGDEELKRLVLDLGKDDDHPLLHATDAKNGGSTDDRYDPRRGFKTLGELFAESDAVRKWGRQKGQVTTFEAEQYRSFAEAKEAELKATFTVSGSTFTGYDRQPGIVLVGTQAPMVSDLFAKATTTENTIRYPREDTFTNAATTVTEGNAKPEASFDTSEVDAAVRKIAVRARVTDELFADFPALAGYVNARLPYMVRLTEDAQLLTGDGNAPNLLGILQTPNIQTQAKGADPTPTAIYKAMIKILATGFFPPDGIVMNPLDWQDIATLQATTGQYIWGQPQDSTVMRMWGLPVVLTTTLTENTGLVGSFQLGAQIFYRSGLTLESTNSNEDDFNKNLISIRAEQREALVCYRPLAFCTVTGV